MALNGSWDVNYGQGGVQNGPNIAFTVPANGMDVVFQWNSTTHELRIVVGGIHGDLTKAQAYWLSADTIAWNVPTDTAVTLFADPDGALTLDGPGIVAGPNSKSWTLAHDPAGLSPALAREVSASREPRGVQAARRRRRSRRAKPERSACHRCRARPVQGVDATSLQIPGVLDDLYSAKAGPVTLGPSFKHGQATLARLGADRAQPGAAPVSPIRIRRRRSRLIPMTLDPASGIWSFTAPAASV